MTTAGSRRCAFDAIISPIHLSSSVLIAFLQDSTTGVSHLCLFGRFFFYRPPSPCVHGGLSAAAPLLVVKDLYPLREVYSELVQQLGGDLHDAAADDTVPNF